MKNNVNVLICTPANPTIGLTETYTSSKEFDTLEEALTNVKILVDTMPPEIYENTFIIIGEKNPLEYFSFGKVLEQKH